MPGSTQGVGVGGKNSGFHFNLNQHETSLGKVSAKECHESQWNNEGKKCSSAVKCIWDGTLVCIMIMFIF